MPLRAERGLTALGTKCDELSLEMTLRPSSSPVRLSKYETRRVNTELPRSRKSS